MNQIEFYEGKLKYETDSWDLSEAIKNNEGVIVVDARSNEKYEIEHVLYSTVGLNKKTIKF